MRGEQFCLNTPTIAILQNDGRGIAVRIPAHEIITVVGHSEEQRLLRVEWNGKALEMFTQDIRERGERVNSASP